jgi:sulfate adenylyltransferase subunit 1 (EFTu-like GTPase family)
VYVVGDKRIFAGRVGCGTLREGQDITVLPKPRRTSVSSIEVYMRQGVREAQAGLSVGVCLRDKLFVERGMVLCAGRLPAVSDRFKATIFWMSDAPCVPGERLTLRVSTQEAWCVPEVLRRIDSSTLGELEIGPLQANDVAEVALAAERPLVVSGFEEIAEVGRLVLVRGQDIVAGGIISSQQAPSVDA